MNIKSLFVSPSRLWWRVFSVRTSYSLMGGILYTLSGLVLLFSLCLETCHAGHLQKVRTNGLLAKKYRQRFYKCMKRNDPSKCERILINFDRIFPHDKITTQNMLGPILEDYMSHKKMEQFVTLAEFSLKKNYIINEEYKNKLKNYLAIIKEKNTNYSAPITNEEKKWLEEINQNFNEQKLLAAAKTAENAFFSLAKKMPENAAQSSMLKRIFKNGINMYLAENDLSSAINFFSQGQKYFKNEKEKEIMPEILKEVAEEISKSMTLQGEWDRHLEEYQKYLSQIDHQVYFPFSLKAWSYLSMAFRKNGRLNDATYIDENKIEKYYQQALKKGEKIDLEDLDAVAQIQLFKLQAKLNQLQNLASTKEKIEQLNSLTHEELSMLKIGSGKVLVEWYQLIIKNYKQVLSEVAEANESKLDLGKDKLPVDKQLEDKINELNKRATGIISKYSIISPANNYFRPNIL